MKLQSLITILMTTAAIAMSATTTLSQSNPNQKVQFICARSRQGNIPTTYAWTPQGRIAVIRWKYSWFNNQTISPQQRCQDVSSRFQNAYDNQSLGYITNGTVKGQAVICTTRDKDGACDITLLTLRPQDDPLEILTDLKDILRGRGTGPIQHSSGKHQVYYQIDIDKFLQTAPVEKE